MAAAPETQRPCRICGGVVDLSNVKPGNKTDCPHCRKLGTRTAILRRKSAPPLAELEDAAADGWDDEAPPATWRDLTGPELADPAATCDRACGCSRPVWRYTPGHTGTMCPDCGPRCWSVSDEAIDRGDEHARAAAPARRPGTPGGPSQAEAWAAERETERTRADLLARVGLAQGISRISADSASDLDWYAEKIGKADARELAQLAAELDGYTIERDGWGRRAAGVPELADDGRAWDDPPAWDEPDDEDDDEDQADEDDAPEQPAGRSYLRVAAELAAESGRRDLQAVYDGHMSTTEMLRRDAQIMRLPRPAGWTDDDYQRETTRRLAEQRQREAQR